MSIRAGLRPRQECTYDVVALGEVMLRLDPGDGRIRTARHFAAWEGGGEYNVARGLRKCFGQRGAIVTALADNEVGRLVEDLVCQGGVDPTWIRWRPYDGIGRAVRNGLNFTERGFGLRGAVGVSDRGHTAASQLGPGDVDWEELFGRQGARWFHTGGIFAGLGAGTADLIEEAAGVARRHGTIVSYDLNYRPSLWRAHGGEQRARDLNRRIVDLVDVLIGNEEDFTAALGFTVEGVDAELRDLPASRFAAMIQDVGAPLPPHRGGAAPRRGGRGARPHPGGAGAGGGFHQRPDLEVLDRVGGGDSFASGLIYGLLQGYEPALALEYGAAHGALAMTTPGDTTMASLAEVEHMVRSVSERIAR